MTPPRRISDRWRLVEQLPAPRGVERWVAEDSDGTEVSAVRVVTDGEHDSLGIRERWVACHRALGRASDPSLVQPLAVVDEQSGVWVVRPALSRHTLADLTGALTPEQVSRIGARLAPAILAGGPALAGGLLPEDVALDRSGAPVLAPIGPLAGSVRLAVASGTAPEVRSGSPPDGAAALYGLGALLYRLATGREVPPGPNRAPPSSRNPRIPLALDRAIMNLLSSQPHERVAAVAAFEPGPVDLTDLLARPQTRATALPPAEVRVTATGLPVWVDGSALRALAPDSMSHLAGQTGIPLAIVLDAAAQGQPLVVATQPDQREADRARRSLQESLGLTVHTPAASSVLEAVGGLLGLGATGAGVLATLGVAVSGLWLPASLVALGTTAVGVATAWMGWRFTKRQRQHRTAQRAREWLEARLQARHRWPEVHGLDQRILGLRKALSEADLPEVIETDIRGVLREVERSLAELMEVILTADRALAAADTHGIRSRLATYERSESVVDEAERDRLTGVLTDLEDLAARRDRQRVQVRALAGSLDGVGAALQAPAALDEAGKSAQLRAAVTRLRETTSVQS